MSRENHQIRQQIRRQKRQGTSKGFGRHGRGGTRQCAAKSQSAAKSRSRSTIKKLTLITLTGLALTGCTAPLIGALTVGQVATIAGLTATAVSGRDLTEHALSLAVGEDCRLLEAALRSDRDFCEPHGSPATEDDFEGLLALLEPGRTQNPMPAKEVQVATLGGKSGVFDTLNPLALGFAPIDRGQKFTNFSLSRADEAAEDTGDTMAVDRLSFGMLQASFGQSWGYRLNAGNAVQLVTSDPVTPQATPQVTPQIKPQARPAR